MRGLPRLCWSFALTLRSVYSPLWGENPSKEGDVKLPWETGGQVKRASRPRVRGPNLEVYEALIPENFELRSVPLARLRGRCFSTGCTGIL